MNKLLSVFLFGSVLLTGCQRDAVSYKSLHDQREQFAQDDRQQIWLSVRWIAEMGEGIAAVLHPDRPATRFSVGENVNIGFTLSHLKRKGELLNLKFTKAVVPAALAKYFAIEQCFCDNVQQLKPGEIRSLNISLVVKPGIPLQRDIIEFRLRGTNAKVSIDAKSDNLVDPEAVKL